MPATQPPVPSETTPVADDQPQGPVAIVTGAGTGIGLALCHRLAARGYRLVLAGRRREPLESAAEALDTETLVHIADMGTPDDAEAVVDAAVAAFGRLDALINNAGGGPLAPIDQHTPDMLRQTLEPTTLGPAVAIARAWPVFTEQGCGRIVNVSSRASVAPFPGFFAYAASKAAVNLLAKSAASEGAAHGIHAFAVAPGAVETPLLRALFDEATIPTNQTMAPDTVAAVIEACLIGAHDDKSGETLHVSSESPEGVVYSVS